MDQIKSILKCYAATESIKATCRQLGVSKNTVRAYLRKAEAFNGGLRAVLGLDEQSFLNVFMDEKDQNESDRVEEFNKRVDYWIKELHRVGVTRRLLWEEYRAEQTDGYEYSQFCQRLKWAIGRRDLTIELSHEPGSVLMLDFSGKKAQWFDNETGRYQQCEVLVGVMPFSQYTFCIALPSQKMSDFVHGINECLRFIGRLPKVILSDNLRSYVTKSDRYEPTFTKLCEQLGDHYQIDLDATRVGRPKDKASVENAVQQVYRHIFAPLRNEVFTSLESLNDAVQHQHQVFNALPYQKREGSRLSCFEDYEQPMMRDLTPELFEMKKVTKAKVQRNYHVFLGEDKHLYSVPYQHVGKETEIYYTRRSIEIFVDQHRVAFHSRLSPHKAGSHACQTDEAHMPRHHREWKLAQGHDAAYYHKEASIVGPATAWAISQVLLSRTHETSSYKSCEGILRLARHFSAERLEAAARRCQEGTGAVSYKMLKDILEKGLDKSTQNVNHISIGLHDNIRGANQYQ